MFVSQGEKIIDQTRSYYQESGKKIDKETWENSGIFYEKFERLASFLSKNKPMENIRDITCHKCKKLNHCASQCQFTGSTTEGCEYCRRYRHTEVACYKKRAAEAILRSDKEKAEEGFPKAILNKDVEPEPEEKKKPVMLSQFRDPEERVGSWWSD